MTDHGRAQSAESAEQAAARTPQSLARGRRTPPSPVPRPAALSRMKARQLETRFRRKTYILLFLFSSISIIT
jgi:hypothetical protein